MCVVLENLDNEYMRERAEDIKDLRSCVCYAYLQKNERALPQYAEKTILIGETLTPTDLLKCLKVVLLV